MEMACCEPAAAASPPARVHNWRDPCLASPCTAALAVVLAVVVVAVLLLLLPLLVAVVVVVVEAPWAPLPALGDGLRLV